MSGKPVKDWTVEEVCAWLEGLGLIALVPAFKANAGAQRHPLSPKMPSLLTPTAPLPSPQ